MVKSPSAPCHPMSPPPQASATCRRRASAAARCSDRRPPADHRGTAAPRPGGSVEVSPRKHGKKWENMAKKWENMGKKWEKRSFTQKKMGDLTIKDGGFTWFKRLTMKIG